ncbi:hypothetical protein BJ322DRAFT_288288 [Thelephora terrestris]|uniref:Uncharacterized protein n=1 Tax=Thelephora terrestris TaxID=56493 RepID=A0A9P6HA49_9AGAM|nr:hypothetical protein BJ322DRAFT_288288 [Thelephora terrestris]
MKKTVKGDKDAKRKAGARKEFNWGMLYMNSDAVVSSVADRMKISKSDISNPDSENAAVKLALAETHVINETKAYLESHGVILDSFSDLTGSGRVSRSDTVIFFEVHGELSRVLIPPAGTIAVVEFVHSDDAAGAFKAVVYRQLGNAIVYLEKGPIGMLKEPASAVSGGGPTTVFRMEPSLSPFRKRRMRKPIPRWQSPVERHTPCEESYVLYDP